MTTFTFTKAEKKKIFARIALCGPTGAGKTFSALRIASGMRDRLGPDARIALIDSERRSASKYADLFDFDVMELETHSPDTYIQAIEAATAAGKQILIIDSLSHAWIGKDGSLEQVDKIAKRMNNPNSFTAWREVTPMHNRLVDALLTFPGHLIVTMRSKMEYVMQTEQGRDGGKGSTSVVKVGMAPVQREGVEYEFDIVGDMNVANEFVVTKTRYPKFKGLIVKEPGEKVGQEIMDWLLDGKDPVAYVQAEADACATIEALTRLKEELITAGVDYFNPTTKAILLKRHGELSRAIAEAEAARPGLDALTTDGQKAAAEDAGDAAADAAGDAAGDRAMEEHLESAAP